MTTWWSEDLQGFDPWSSKAKSTWRQLSFLSSNVTVTQSRIQTLSRLFFAPLAIKYWNVNESSSNWLKLDGCRWRTASCCRPSSPRCPSSTSTEHLAWSSISPSSMSFGRIWWSELPSLRRAKRPTGESRWTLSSDRNQLFWLLGWTDIPSWKSCWRRASLLWRCRLSSRWWCRCWSIYPRWVLVQPPAPGKKSCEVTNFDDWLEKSFKILECSGFCF